VKAFQSFSIFFISSVEKLEISISAFISSFLPMRWACIAHFTARFVSGVGKLCQQKIGNLAHGFVPIEL
jgi:hypothetical protein